MSIAEAASKFQLWKERPDIFVREVFGVIPDAWQDKVLQAFPHKQRIAMKASKGVGKSAVEAWIAWNFLLTRSFPMIAATSVTGANLADGFWAECARWQQKSPLLSDNFTWTQNKIFMNEYPSTWYMSARPWSKTADKEEQGKTLAGIHADNIMFIIDESGGVPEAVAASAEAALSSCDEGHIIQAGNPTDLSGMLYRACTRDKALWHVVEISSDPDSPLRSSRVSVDWARQQIAMYGRDNPWVLVNVYGEFPPAAFNALIGVEEVNESMRRSYVEQDYCNAPRIIGVDVARGGADASIIFPRQGLQAFAPSVHRNIDGMQGANLVARKWNEWEADACFVDNTGGFGSSWVDNLSRLGFSPIPVHFSQKSDNPRYFNKRTEMIFELVEWIKKGGALPQVPEIVAELTESTYTFKNDKIILEPKELLKIKIGRSCDHMDSLALTWASPVIKAPKYIDGWPIEQVRGHPYAKDYHPYSRDRARQIGGKR